MLSSASSITDVKKGLIDHPEEYGFVDDETFDAGIEDSIETTKIKIMIPAISSKRYEEIKAKNKTINKLICPLHYLLLL